MSTITSTDERLRILEYEVAELKRQLRRAEPGGDPVQQFAGGFAGDSDFEEIVRLGRELRDAEPPVNEEEGG